ncbi:MAG TPA: alpha/beta hydrolase [Blastocatellia bacterium]
MKYFRITIALAAVIAALAFPDQAKPGTRKIVTLSSPAQFEPRASARTDGRRPADGMFDANGVNLHYIVQGEGESVVLIHGLRSSARMNWQMPGIVGLLSKKYKVIAVDMPGHGESDKPANEDAYGLELVEDVVRLLDHLKIRKAHIVGYSMGGMIAIKFMATHQERTLSGVVGGMGWLREGSPLQMIWERLPDRGGITPPACARSLGKLAVTEAELKSIRVPVVVIVGDRDPVRRLYVAPLQPVRKDWKVIEIEDAGHLNCVVKAQFKEAIAEWLDSQERGQTGLRRRISTASGADQFSPLMYRQGMRQGLFFSQMEAW